MQLRWKCSWPPFSMFKRSFESCRIREKLLVLVEVCSYTNRGLVDKCLQSVALDNHVRDVESTW